MVSHGIPEEGGIITLVLFQLHLRKRVLTRRLVCSISFCVLPAQVYGHEGSEHHRKGTKSEEGAMSRAIVGCIFGLENEA